MPRCYSERMLNPFHGVAHVVETDGADAVSSDGITWTLFVHGEQEQAEMEDGTLREVETPDIKFGVWSAEMGLKRSPVRNVVDYQFVDMIGGHLLETIKSNLERLPFPQRDYYELWLLDSAFDLPLALLESECDEAGVRDDVTLMWRAGLKAQEQFCIDHRLAGYIGEDNPALTVQRIVNRAAGSRARAQWFRRLADGSGVAVAGIRVDERLQGRTLPPEAFPEQQLRSHWPDEAAQQLIRAYLDWQAPWLLMLSHLSDTTRDRLEQVAGRRAMVLDESHALLPKVIDVSRIVAARVEAAMRRAAGEVQGSAAKSDALFPFFNE